MHVSSRRWLLLGLVALALALFFGFDLDRALTLEALRAQRGALAATIAAHPLASAGAYFAAYVAVTALSLPAATLLTLAGGALFGFGPGLLLVSFASTLGATLAMLLARTLLREAVQLRFGARLQAIDAGLAREGAFYLFALRLVPLFPFFLVNLAIGLTRMPARTYFWVSQLGMLPATAVYVYAGTELGRVDTLRGLVSPGLLGAFALLGLLPLATRRLLDALRARRVYARWRRPARFDYNLLAIGAGSAGLVTSYIGAAVKAKVALVERHRMGGDCLNTGCVPSKALIRTARLLADARRAPHYGVRALHADFDFAAAMERVQQVIAQVAPHDSVERYRGLGVDCIAGEARLVDPWTVEVDGRRICARQIVIATGARPTVPLLPGLDSVDYLTSDTVWGLREQPRRLLVLGGGPIGCELGQCFARLGCEVTIVQRNPRLLPREDADASAALRAAFEHEGIALALGAQAVRVEKDGAGGRLVVQQDGGERAIAFDRLLLALGRTPNVAGFGLEELGVRLGADGRLEVDAWMRSSLPNILACGDVVGPHQFTHVAAHQAWYAAVNALFAPFWSYRADYRVIPWCTFTDPEIARVGLSEAEARAQGVAFEVSRYGLDDLDRAIADGHAEGYVKVLTEPGRDRILGACIVGAHAGDLLAEFVLAMRHGLGLRKILATIHSYPTMMEANQYAAGVWARAHAPAGVLRWLERWHAWRRC
ncbi:MAG: FAD-dependent oxidoreductase [Xanthomonadales bacterium]|nr:Soluble pyridine nucleotide transhydrogenase [Xanthomonadales bacterium]MCC6593638.1 FAD-dependent oxidoreductase [Xanthomonadales bacterium]